MGRKLPRKRFYVIKSAFVFFPLTPVKLFAKFSAEIYLMRRWKKVAGQGNCYREPGNGGNPAGTAPVKGLS